MEKKDTNTEHIIKKAAEYEFLTRGYAGAKTTEIAKRAGVNHAMLHYYFRTKENLFNIVFEEMIQVMASSFAGTFDQDLPFFEKIQLGIETHFNIMEQNPRLPFFIYSEIITNEKRKEMFAQKLYPNISRILKDLQTGLDIEVEKGKAKPAKAIDILLNIISLNVFAFLAEPFLSLIGEKNHINYKELLQHRKENNVQVILKSLQP